MHSSRWVRWPRWTVRPAQQQTTTASAHTDGIPQPQPSRRQDTDDLRSGLGSSARTAPDIGVNAATRIDSPIIPREPFFGLRIKDGVYWIYGFLPSPSNYGECLPRLFLKTRSHAFCLHVLGESPDPSTTCEDRIDIPVFTQDKSVLSFCEHLRRCGATELSASAKQKWEPEYFFGWPSNGGVWVLPIPHAPIVAGRLGESWRPYAYARLESKGLVPPADDLLERLGHALHMDHYCEILEALGARYYTDPQASVEVRDASLRAYRDALEMAEPMNMSVSRYVDGSDPCDIPWLRIELPLQVMELMMEEDLPLYSRDRLILNRLQRKFARRPVRGLRTLDHNGMMESYQRLTYDHVGLDLVEETSIPGRADGEDEELELRLMQLQLAT